MEALPAGGHAEAAEVTLLSAEATAALGEVARAADARELSRALAEPAAAPVSLVGP